MQYIRCGDGVVCWLAALVLAVGQFRILLLLADSIPWDHLESARFRQSIPHGCLYRERVAILLHFDCPCTRKVQQVDRVSVPADSSTDVHHASRAIVSYLWMQLIPRECTAHRHYLSRGPSDCPVAPIDGRCPTITAIHQGGEDYCVIHTMLVEAR